MIGCPRVCEESPHAENWKTFYILQGIVPFSINQIIKECTCQGVTVTLLPQHVLCFLGKAKRDRGKEMRSLANLILLFKDDQNCLDHPKK